MTVMTVDSSRPIFNTAITKLFVEGPTYVPKERAPYSANGGQSAEGLEMETLGEAFAEIESFGGLDDNWDSHGGRAVTPKTVNIAKDVLGQIAGDLLKNKMVMLPPEVSPNSGGGISVSWESGDNFVLIRVSPQDYSMVQVVRQSGQPPARVVQCTVDQAASDVRWIHDLASPLY